LRLTGADDCAALAAHGRARGSISVDGSFRQYVLTPTAQRAKSEAQGTLGS